MEVLVDYPLYKRSLRYRLAFSAVGQRFEINDEVLENEFCDDPQHHSQPFFYYRFNGGRPLLSVSKLEDREDRKELPKEPHRELRKEDIDLERSILAQRRDPDHYPELTWLADMLGLEFWPLYPAPPASEGGWAQSVSGAGCREPGSGPEPVFRGYIRQKTSFGLASETLRGDR